MISISSATHRWVRDLSLVWKLLIPYIALIVAVGVAGTYVVVRDLSKETDESLDRQLVTRSLDVRSGLRDRELYLVESSNFASNLQGMAAAIQSRDASQVSRLLGSVIALKTDLDVAAIAVLGGPAVVEFGRRNPDARMEPHPPGRWDHDFVREAATSLTGERRSGVVDTNGVAALVIAAPVCSGVETCDAVGAAVVGISLERMARTVMGGSDTRMNGLAIYRDKVALVRVGTVSARNSPDLPSDGTLRSSRSTEEARIATLYAPWEVQTRRLGVIGVSMRTAYRDAGVRDTALRLVLVVGLTMAGIIGIGVLLSRFILIRIRRVIETHRALGRGQLHSRAPIDGNDELGVLSRGVNQMAEQLEASYSTLETRVAQRTEEVERLLRERTAFFASVSHELRTPLAVILRHSEMMLDPSYPKNGRWSREAGKALRGSAEQLKVLVNDILDLAQAEAGAIEVAMSEVDVTVLLKELRPTIRGLASASGLRSEVAVQSGLPRVQADPIRLRQIILNLVDNAVKYTPEGGRLTVSGELEGQFVSISVTDSGVGIPKNVGDRIFEPFHRVEGIVAQKGQASSGLGLALAKRLVEAQGGSLTYSSDLGSGTTFTFNMRIASLQSLTSTP